MIASDFSTVLPEVLSVALCDAGFGCFCLHAARTNMRLLSIWLTSGVFLLLAAIIGLSYCA